MGYIMVHALQERTHVLYVCSYCWNVAQIFPFGHAQVHLFPQRSSAAVAKWPVLLLVGVMTCTDRLGL